MRVATVCIDLYSKYIHWNANVAFRKRNQTNSHRFHIHHKVAFTKKYTNIPHYYACVFTKPKPIQHISFRFSFNAYLSSNHLILFWQSNFGSTYLVSTCRLFPLQLFRIWYAKWFLQTFPENFTPAKKVHVILSSWQCIDYKLTSIAFFLMWSHYMRWFSTIFV